MNISSDGAIKTADSLRKLFNKEVVDDEELECIKVFLTGYGTFSDMSEIEKDNINKGTIDNIFEVVEESIKQTVYRSFKLRYGITINV